MNWLTLTLQNLQQKTSLKFLLIFSGCLIAGAGIVWACAGGDEEDYSVFSPEYFVNESYSPFFYDSYNMYYHESGWRNDDENDNNVRYNDQITEEWAAYLQNKIPEKQLSFLLLSANSAQIDSVKSVLKVDGDTRLHNLFAYLPLAKECEKIAVKNLYYSWQDKPAAPEVSTDLEPNLLTSFRNTKDAFIKERLWFQVVRYYFFEDRSAHQDTTVKSPHDVKIIDFFNAHENEFKKDLTYYRAMGYLAGYYYGEKEYALANYLYSLCYAYTVNMRIPSKWSFHPQNEEDWQQTLKLAKSPNEKITLWHMLGMEFDPGRAIKEIAAIDPKSEKIDLLLSRLINIRENEGHEFYGGSDTVKNHATDILTIDQMANRKDIAKPWFWHLAAGYLHFLNSDYVAAAKWYVVAKKELPANNQMLQAQYKLLHILLQVHTLKRIDIKAESQLTEPLIWLANLRDQKDSVKYLRFNNALDDVTATMAKAYQRQHEGVKASLLSPVKYNSYNNPGHVDSLIALLNKPNKTPFEIAMLRYYPYKVQNLYYLKGTLATYSENNSLGITYMKKAGKLGQSELLGNPFNIRLNDCHDCDHEAKQKKKYTSLSFLQTIDKLKQDLTTKTNYNAAYLLANAYYNITYYGNARYFYQTEITSQTDSDPVFCNTEFGGVFTSMKLAQKYYLLARSYATNNEQRAKCTFMLSKCAHNSYYNRQYLAAAKTNKYIDGLEMPPAGNFFAELKAKFSKTAYYREVIQECGYFRNYLKGGHSQKYKK